LLCLYKIIQGCVHFFTMKRDRFIFIINPIAGGLDKTKYVHKLDYIFANYQKDYSIHDTKGEPDDPQRAKEAIVAYQPDVVVAVGGDGTCNMVAQLIADENVLFGIVPLGSANGLATELNIEDDVDAATDLLFTGVEKKMDAIVINDEHICLHLSDIGLNAKVVRRFEEGKKRGMLGYVRQFIREIYHSQPNSFVFELKGNTFKKKAHMVVIANASKYGTGAIVNPVGKIDDGKFEICIVKPFPFYGYFSITFQMFKGTLKTSPFVDIISTQHIKIYNKPKEVLQIDGEIRGYPDTVEASIKKHAFRLIVPQPDL